MDGLRRSRLLAGMIAQGVLFPVLFLSCCGAWEGDGSRRSDARTGIRMGGSIQGTPLSLAGAVLTIAGSPRTGSADGTGKDAAFSMPCGVTTDGATLFVSDTYNHTIRAVAVATGAVTTLAGSAGSSGSADGAGTAARFFYPEGITTDGASLFVADRANGTIRKVEISTGAVTTLAGSAGSAGYADGIGSAARFLMPYGITTDGTSLFVAEKDNHTIRKVEISTGTVTTLAGGAGSAGSADGEGAAARFNYPSGIATDGAFLFVADTCNCTIRKVEISTGTVTTLAGSAGSCGSEDGSGAAAGFDYPHGVTTDGATLFVSDTYNQTVRMVAVATGETNTLAGVVDVLGYADGVGSAAMFHNPIGITTDGTALFVADMWNNSIREIR